MPDHIRALIVVLFLATFVFAFAKKPACQIILHSDFTRRRNLWLAITLTAFLAPNFWFYTFIAGILLIIAFRKETNVSALFFFLLFVIPNSNVQIPGFGPIDNLFIISHQRLLAFVILLPAYLVLLSRKNTLPFGKIFADKILLGYILLVVALYLRETTITDTFREILYQFIDVFLPYYVISRSIKNIKDFRAVLLCFVIATMILAAIAVIEATKHWLLYASLVNSLDLKSAMTTYASRAGIVRAVAAAGHPIALGYLMAIAIGFYLFLQPSIKSTFHRRMGLLLLIAGLLAPLSRGPWIGAACIIAVFITTGKRAGRKLSALLLVGVIAISVLSVIPGGEKIINLIPFIGETEKGNIDYRARLFEVSLIGIKRHPWLGSVNFREAPEMESMRQGEGIIDIVNTYIRVALESGFIGLFLFTGFFLTICRGIYQGFRRLPDNSSEERLLGRTLMATLAGALVIIATVSSITIIPIVYWSVAGLGAAYINMMNRSKFAQEPVDNAGRLR